MRRLLPVLTVMSSLAVFISGLGVSSPLEVYVPPSLYRPLGVVFALSCLTLLLLGVVYVIVAMPLWYQGRTWSPLLLSTASLGVAITTLRLLDFNFHLYGPWLMLSLATGVLSAYAISILIVVRVWGVFTNADSQQNHNSGTA